MPELSTSVFTELGKTGLKSSYGYIQEEFLPQLQGGRAAKVYAEMSANDAIVGAVLYAIEMMLRGVSWHVEGPHAEFVDECRHDMSHSWEDFMAEAMSMLPYGWAYHEICYKPRVDGMVGWKKLPIRGQDTLSRWELDAEGGVKGMWQSCAGVEVLIPIDKALHFRTSQAKNNPEGKSILRTAYRSWWYKKRISEIEAVGIERDLAGIPVAYVPAEWLDDSASSEAQAAVAAVKEIVTNLRNDEQAGLVWPLSFDESGNKLTDIQLMSSPGRRQFTTGEVIARYSLEIAQSVLFDMLLMGHEKVGSYALSSTKDAWAIMGLQSKIEHVARVFNKYAIPRLLELNGLDTSTPTMLVPGDLKPVDVQMLVESIWKLAMSGMPIWPAPNAEEHVRRLLGLPEDEGQVPLPVMQQAANAGMSEDDDDSVVEGG